MTTPALTEPEPIPQCSYCLAEHPKDEHCRCYICHVDMHPQFLCCVTIDGFKTVLCPNCDKTTHRFDLVKRVVDLGARLLPKPHEGYDDDCKTARDQTMQLILEDFVPLIQDLTSTDKNPTVYVIHYDIHNGTPDSDFFWSKEARDTQLRKIMEEVIEELKEEINWNELSPTHRQACLDVEQLISHDKIEEAFSSPAWYIIKRADDFYHLFDALIPTYVLQQHQRIAQLETALKAMGTLAAPFMKAEWGGGGLPYQSEYMSKKETAKREIAWKLLREALHLSEPPPLNG
ncbi:MAG TPA: hypothetical protein VGH19_06850 [Verrucomicrobiae bacterium]